MGGGHDQHNATGASEFNICLLYTSRGAVDPVKNQCVVNIQNHAPDALALQKLRGDIVNAMKIAVGKQPDVYKRQVEYARCDLYAQSDVERSLLLLVLHRIGSFLSGKYAKLTLAVLFVLALLYFGLTLLLNKRRRTRRPRPRRPKRYR